SGGERQRVAVGRALLARPQLLLMDEPLSALDRTAKDEILPYLEALHETLAMPMLYVSHDIAEVERLADHVVLLDSGRVVAAGALADIQADPALPLLEAAGAAVTLEGEVAAIDESYGLTTFAVDGGRLVVPGRIGQAGVRRRLRIGVADVSFARLPAEASSILNCVPARILSVSPHRGADIQVNVLARLGEDGAGARIAGRITRKSQDALGIAPGAGIFVQIKSVALVAGPYPITPAGSAPASSPPHRRAAVAR
ncbi:MAG: TOBE domain-containing protein, partial [Alphaproteobacteria bacterium]